MVVAVRTLVFGLITFIAGCGYENDQSAVNPFSDSARMSDDLYMFILYLMTGVSILVAVLIIYAMVKFRYKGETERPKQVHGHTLLETTWTILPCFLLIAIMVPTTKPFSLSNPPTRGCSSDQGHRKAVVVGIRVRGDWSGGRQRTGYSRGSADLPGYEIYRCDSFLLGAGIEWQTRRPTVG